MRFLPGFAFLGDQTTLRGGNLNPRNHLPADPDKH
jgi:hypothetical protein